LRIFAGSSRDTNPAARHLFILAKATHLTHLLIAEYVALFAAADITGHDGVGVLLESCLADKLAFVERTRRLIRNLIEGKVAKKIAERVAAWLAAPFFNACNSRSKTIESAPPRRL
jgi:ferritin-like metal-binding protein YciE